METFIIIAQAIGIFGMAMNVISYQAKKQRNIIFCQFFGSVLFAVNMFMLGKNMGGLLNIVGILRGLVYMNKDKVKHLNLWTSLFFALYMASYFATFAFLGQEANTRNLLVELLPLIGMIATNIGFVMKDAKSVRYSAFVSSPSWLLYNFLGEPSIGGILCECFSIISATTALIRHDLKGKKANMQ